MKKWWHSLATIGIIALGVFTPPIQTAIVGHPLIASVLGGIWTILGHILPSPLADQAK